MESNFSYDIYLYWTNDTICINFSKWQKT